MRHQALRFLRVADHLATWACAFTYSVQLPQALPLPRKEIRGKKLTLALLKPNTCKPSIDVARESATYAWPFSNTLLRSTLTRSSAVLVSNHPCTESPLCEVTENAL